MTAAVATSGNRVQFMVPLTSSAHAARRRRGVGDFPEAHHIVHIAALDRRFILFP
jgi:hypothetical protein